MRVESFVKAYAKLESQDSSLALDMNLIKLLRGTCKCEGEGWTSFRIFWMAGNPVSTKA